MKIDKQRWVSGSALALATGVVISACSGGGQTPGGSGPEDTGEATLALTSVPSNVACLRVTVVGSRTDIRNFDVTPGHSTTMTLRGLPIGNVTFQEDAFAEACSAVTASSVPTWFSDAVPATLVSRLVTAVRIILLPNGQATVTSDFVNDGGPPTGSGGTSGTGGTTGAGGGPCVPITQTAACNGKECGSASNGCGSFYSCGSCEPDSCFTVTCVSNFCNYRAPACLATGTPITLADGTTRPIEQIRVGDSVLAYDVGTGTPRPQRVSQTFHHAAEENAEGIVVVDGSIVSTGNHPFYANGRWVRADALSPGDRLVRLSGDGASTAAVGTVRALPENAETWNLEVEGDHDYFAGGVLVHNKPPPCP